MSGHRWQRLDRIFVDALQQQPQRRASFVEEACVDDPVLRQEVLSLLTAADASGEFMAVSALERLAQDVAAHGYTLTPGEQVGAYTVVGLIGAGGTGEVWRARDARLSRDVAIKVLLPHLSADAGRLRRFADEARAAGSLNHPNIVAVYDVGEHRGAPYLVSEYLDGETLRARLREEAMSADRVVAAGVDIARALVAAHGRKIVHRDLKPENVFVRPDGVAKVLDFGLAKLQSFDAPTTPGTMTGVVLGTAGYMAPEQVRGEEVDPRADLFALGVMLYEMLTGTAPFKRASAFETLHAVLTVEPPGVGELNPAVPDALAALVMRLLKKDRNARFQTAADLVWALELTGSNAVADRARAPVTSAAGRRDGRTWLAVAVTTAAVAAAAAAWIPGGPRAAGPGVTGTVTRFTWALPSGVTLASAPAVSPDGRHVAFTGASNGRPRLYIRSLSSFEAAPIQGSEGARLPFWSPDSRWIGFFSGGRVMKVPVAGGAPMAVADDRDAGVGTRRNEMGGAWSRDDVIVYGANFNPPALVKVPASGGIPVPATQLVVGRGENQHRFPFFLPDGRHFLYLARGSTAEGRGVFVGSVDGVEQDGTRVLDVESNAVYAPITGSDAGVLLYVVNGRVEARRFDAPSRTLIGLPQPLAIEAGGPTLFAPAAIGASSDVLAYATQLGSGSEIKVTRDDGTMSAVQHERQEQQWPRISPDGTRMAWLLIDAREPNADIWVEDLARGTRTRVTIAPTRDLGHVWSPDGRWLAYRPDVDDRRRLTIVAADGSGTSRDLVCPTTFCEPTDWSSDGRELIVNAYERTGTDVWAVAIEPGDVSRPLLRTRFNERDARVSPNRQWIAYVSDEAGRPEVSVRSLNGTPRRYSVSPDGGDQVVWQRDGRALLYVDPNGRLRRVSIREAGAHLLLGDPAELPVTVGSGHSNTQYDVAPDGRIYYLDPTPAPQPTEIRVVLGWQALLHR